MFRRFARSAVVLLAWLPWLAWPLAAQDAATPPTGEIKRTPPADRVPPRVIFQVAPEYPEALRRSHIKGDALVGFEVDEHGQVQNPVVVTSNDPEFEDPAIRAVLQWKFTAATENGHPITTHLVVPIVFQMGGDPDNGEPSFRVERTMGTGAPPVIRGVRRPVYPYDLRRAGIAGRARAAVTVDERGRIAGIDIIASSRPEFAQALVAAIEGFAFNPARKDGTPVRAILLYEQSFDDANLDDPASVELLDLERNHPAAIHSFKDLDAIPHPLSRRRPIFPRSLPASVTHGAATVVFLIDTDGHARLPRVLAASDPAFGYAATQAVASWIFDPPTIQSHAVVARAQIPIAFAVAPPAK